MGEPASRREPDPDRRQFRAQSCRRCWQPENPPGFGVPGCPPIGSLRWSCPRRPPRAGPLLASAFRVLGRLPADSPRAGRRCLCRFRGGRGSIEHVAETDAVRSRRKRRHAAGDHSQCVPGRCLRAPQQAPPDPVAVDSGEARWGQATRAAVETISALAYEPGDPRWLISVTTIRLAQAFDKSPTPALAAEIRRNVTWLVTEDNQPADVLDEIRAGLVQSKADMLIQHALAVMPQEVC